MRRSAIHGIKHQGRLKFISPFVGAQVERQEL